MQTDFLLRLSLMAAVFYASHQLADPLRADEPQDWTFSWHKAEVTGLAFIPDGTKLISTSLRDDRISTVVAGEKQTELIGDAVGKITGARSHAVAVSPDGTRAVIAGFKVTSMHDLTTSRELWNIRTLADEYSPPFVTAVAFSPDGRRLATSGASSKVGGPHGYKGGLITIRDVKSGEEIQRYDDLSHASDSIAFSPDGKLFAAGTFGAGGELPQSGELRVWDAKYGSLLHTWKLKDSVRAGKDHAAAAGIAFSPDSRTIAIASSDGVVRLWDVASRQTRTELKGHRSGVRRVVFSKDGRILASAGSDRTVRIWNTDSGQQIKSFSVKFPKVNALIFSPDGNLLVAGGGDFLRMGEVRMWSVQNVN
jgi:WD40 repeat protein